MGITLVLKLVSSDINPGFTVWLQVRNDPEGLCLLERVGYLPADPELENLYQDWQISFRNLINGGRNSWDQEWEIDDIPPNISRDDDFEACRKYIRLLEENMEHWLDSCTDRGWQEIQQDIPFYLGKHSPEVRLVIQSDSQLWKLPWLTWNLLKKFDSQSGTEQIGIGFSPVEYKKLESLNRGERQGNFVRILAVFGSDNHLDLEPDRMALQQLTEAEVETLNKPTGRKLIEKLRDPQGWDVFCFSGHSQTKGKDGIIYINETENLELRQFQEALKTAIRQGLKLAIFNSCDGLGLAEKLAGLQLPVAIVMKEPVPDSVAQCFLKVFLSEYASGVPLYTAVRRSQAQLEYFPQYPGCSSLPIICQNPAEVPPTWAELSQRKPIVPPPEISPQVSPVPWVKSPSLRWQKLRRTLAASFAIALFVLSAQWHGKLQTLELYAFDHLMRQLPSENRDTRLLLIGANTDDLRRYGYPIPDSILAQLIEKINQYHPAAIGLNITREVPIENVNYPGGHEALLTQLNSFQDNVVSVCNNGNNLGESTKPLSGIQDPEKQVGFIDLYRDQDFTQTKELRRYLLSTRSNPLPWESHCVTPYSLALQLFERYLRYHYSPIDIETPHTNWKFGSFLIPSLVNRTGGYQNLKGYGLGSQILIRYRKTRNINQIGRQISIQDVLQQTNAFEPEDISGKVVFIGVTDPIVQKLFLTPYGDVNQLSIHAHVVSQLISAFEGQLEGKNQRPLIWWWPQWVNMLWIVGWSFLGGLLIWLFPQPVPQWIAISSTILVLYGICWIVLTQGGWIPLVPAILTLVGPTMIFTGLTLSKIKSFE
ncbi:CHASE2 domain-containing protein [Laspinema sp. A4]|uniref:CHASE2 domain-containing protein n=1 Tax=Laspinema sp. D2d TaxID=2953686 RepID=UPI0021BB2B87|nr:CHASE2 domain-containing protein [Laspinema sp. D2d]MCT7982225.1 CHASE2 domain-containing protein [Laspinema sp. D2d]